MSTLKRFFSLLLALCFANLTLLQGAQAALVSTEQVARVAAGERAGEPARERLAAAFARADVRTELERHGLSPELAQQRIAALTDEEAATLAQHVESAPAGGIIGAILLVFFVLLVTDILGLTKVFPFTRPIR